MWDSILEDNNCSLIPLLHSSQVHSLLVYGKYCISQSQNNSLSPLNVLFFDSRCKVLKRRPVLHERQEKTISSSPDVKSLEVPGCFHNLPPSFSNRNTVLSFPVVYKRGTKNYTHYTICPLKCFLSRNLTTVSNNPPLKYWPLFTDYCST